MNKLVHDIVRGDGGRPLSQEATLYFRRGEHFLRLV